MNSILHGESSNYAVYSAGTLTSEYNDVYNSSSSTTTYGGSAAAGTGDISSNPMWSGVSDDSNPYNDDWSLQSGSPAIDAGSTTASYDDTDGSLSLPLARGTIS